MASTIKPGVYFYFTVQNVWGRAAAKFDTKDEAISYCIKNLHNGVGRLTILEEYTTYKWVPTDESIPEDSE